MNLNLPKLSGYIGATLMAAFAFTMNPALAIIGLVLLTVQSYDAKMWNLVTLNFISIFGFVTQVV